MPADITTQRNPTHPSPLLQPLTLTFAGLTLLFALFSMILGNRAATLQADYLKAEKESTVSEAASVEELKASLNAATTNLNTVQQALTNEKTTVDKLRRKLSTVVKDLKKTQAELTSANQTISNLKSALSVGEEHNINAAAPATPPQSYPSTQDGVSQKPSPQPAAPPSVPSPAQPASVPAPTGKPIKPVPTPSAAPTPTPITPKPNNRVEETAPPASKAPASDNRPGVEEKATTDSPEAPLAVPTPAAD